MLSLYDWQEVVVILWELASSHLRPIDCHLTCNLVHFEPNIDGAFSRGGATGECQEAMETKGAVGGLDEKRHNLLIELGYV